MRVLGSSVGLAVTGVAGPAEQDDVPVGTVFVAVAIAGSDTVTRDLRLPGQREQIRQFAVIGALDLFRRQLVLRGAELAGSPPVLSPATGPFGHFRARTQIGPAGFDSRAAVRTEPLPSDRRGFGGSNPAGGFAVAWNVAVLPNRCLGGSIFP